jgi:hypothetical protein
VTAPMSRKRSETWAPLFLDFPFWENLVKGVEAGFWDQVVDSMGEINRLICPNHPMRDDIIKL